MLKYILPVAFAALILGAVALIAFWTQQPLLAPSLGAAAFSQVLHPKEKAGTPYNLTAGQIIGGIAGFVGVWIVGQQHAPAFVGEHALPLGRVAAVAIAGVLAVAGQMAARARSPTGGATALVVALGVETANLSGAVRLLVGIALVMALGEVCRLILVRTEEA